MLSMLQKTLDLGLKVTKGSQGCISTYFLLLPGGHPIGHRDGHQFVSNALQPLEHVTRLQQRNDSRLGEKVDSLRLDNEQKGKGSRFAKDDRFIPTTPFCTSAFCSTSLSAAAFGSLAENSACNTNEEKHLVLVGVLAKYFLLCTRVRAKSSSRASRQNHVHPEGRCDLHCLPLSVLSRSVS